MKRLGWLIGVNIVLALLLAMAGMVAFFGGAPFSSGPLSAEHPLDRPIAGVTTHADFESHCDWCHAPFRGPDASLCAKCHSDVGDQVTHAQGLHGALLDPIDCAACHPDHRGRTAALTQASLAELPHNQFGFTLVSHQRGYGGASLTCRSCHSRGMQSKQDEPAVVQAACIECHQRQDARFVADHRAEMGTACLACHDGSDRLKGFDHAAVFPLQLQHSKVPCAKCHVDNRFRGTPRECVACHSDPQVHRGQFGANCAACHAATGWRPARLVRHDFPLNHGNQGKESACKTCHPVNYAAYTCYNCHDHTQANMRQVHAKAGIRDIQNCDKCHRTGQKVEKQ